MRGWRFVGLALLLAACEGSALLALQVRTDLTPERDFASVSVALATPEGERVGSMNGSEGVSRRWSAPAGRLGSR